MVEEQTTTSEPQDVVTRAEAILAEVKAREQKLTELHAKNQATEARIILGGQSVAGQAPIQHEETPQEYKNRIMGRRA